MDLRILTEPQQGATYANILRSARASELAGFGGFFRSDHLLAMAGADGRPGPTDAWTTLAGLARDTSNIRLGTLVSPVTFRPPGLLAIQVAQVDAMSGGRIELGLGAGWFAAEHAALGLVFPGVKTRFAMLAEQLAIVRGVWESPEGSSFSFDGDHYTLVDNPALPKPRQRRLPIIMGGTGPRRTPALAASYADEFNAPFVTAAEAGRLREAVIRECTAIGRDPAELTWSAAHGVACGHSRQDVDRRAAAAGISPERFREKYLAGSPAEIAERITAYTAAGFTRMYLQLPDLSDVRHIELLGAEVAPLLAGAHRSSQEGAVA